MPHLHEAIDFAVVALLVHDQKVLLVDHRELGLWLPPGGHVELSEDTDQALFREVEEETGLGPTDIEVINDKPSFEGQDFSHVVPLFAPHWVDIHRINEHHRHIGFYYLCRTKRSDVKLASGEHYAIRWFLVAELDASDLKIPPDIRFYAKEAIRLLS